MVMDIEMGEGHCYHPAGVGNFGFDDTGGVAALDHRLRRWKASGFKAALTMTSQACLRRIKKLAVG